MGRNHLMPLIQNLPLRSNGLLTTIRGGLANVVGMEIGEENHCTRLGSLARRAGELARRTGELVGIITRRLWEGTP